MLIGAETAERDWVGYEIKESYKKGNGLLGIYIHNVVDLDRRTDVKGKNPFDNLYIENKTNGQKTYLSQTYKTYDWVNDNGYGNFASWVDQAARQAGK